MSIFPDYRQKEHTELLQILTEIIEVKNTSPERSRQIDAINDLHLMQIIESLNKKADLLKDGLVKS